jgi:hypothetical protein
MASRNGDGVRTLEEGHLYVFWRPKVEQREPASEKDVQRLYLVLSPEGKRRYRLLVVGRRKLPDPGAPGRSRRWAFVQAVERDPRELLDALAEERYETKTRGTRYQPAARPAGQGIYQILRHDDHTHMAYTLEIPDAIGEVQEALGIEQEASYIVAVRNPEAPAPQQAGLPRHERPDYPDELVEKVRGRKFADADPPELLDYEGCELLLIAAADDVRADLGIELESEEEGRQRAAIFRDLKLRKSQQPVAPLFEGRWE